MVSSLLGFAARMRPHWLPLHGKRNYDEGQRGSTGYSLRRPHLELTQPQDLPTGTGRGRHTSPLVVVPKSMLIH
ncbi:hypothetical protein IEO21_01125 [Rhodonia placenta]|uniref:Uncharacterized protein n=1 Tax=Rhodonia placenta TaxID=104341 RepID=A0A8H7PAC3_9APHY|nr:hypothetical protein IEO21_01125 [Postia placenta]